MARKHIFSGVLVTLVLVLVGAAAFYVMWPQMQPHTTLRIGDGVFAARVATSDTDRATGLSNTNNLPADQAMIFVFNSDYKWPMWMKNMNYPLDMLWLNKDKNVVHIVKNASPDSYPDKFVPNSDARYVIEVPAGTVDQKTIRIGSGAMFDENNLSGVKL